MTTDTPALQRDEDGLYIPDTAFVRDLATRIIQTYGPEPSLEEIGNVVEGGDWPGRDQLDDGDIEILTDEVRDAVEDADLAVSWR